MSGLLKDLYSDEFYDNFSEVVRAVFPAFEPDKFKKLMFDETWHSKELKQRMRHTTLTLHIFFPDEFHKAGHIIEKIINQLRRGTRESSVEYMFLPDYIEVFGINDFDNSVKLIEFVTLFTSCEFAVRPFIIKYGDKMIKQMYQWSLNENHHIRRLASEGIRPRLPWAIALPGLKKDPAPILPILENLKKDPSEYVRRSVANNLNDISKDHPNTVISIAKRWKGVVKETDSIIKHGCRTLLRQGHTEILRYFELDGGNGINISNFRILTPALKIGDSLEFSFTIQNTQNKPRNVRLEYGIYYATQNGRLSKKIYKISERSFTPKKKCDICRKQSFKIITTRKFYRGTHRLSIIINGRERKTGDFELT